MILAERKVYDIAAIQAARMAERGLPPWACQNCGCTDFRFASEVETTRKPDTSDAVVRYRIGSCRHCGRKQRITTNEVVVPNGYEVRVVKKEDDGG